MLRKKLNLAQKCFLMVKVLEKESDPPKKQQNKMPVE
jgi:hypothetical protein